MRSIIKRKKSLYDSVQKDMKMRKKGRKAKFPEMKNDPHYKLIIIIIGWKVSSEIYSFCC